LHVFTHSMGARLLCQSLPNLIHHLKPVQVAETHDVPTASRPLSIELATCTFLHPEHDLHTFIEHDFDLLHAVCPCITIYLDRHDGALWAAEWVNQQPSLGKHPFALVRKCRDLAQERSSQTRTARAVRSSRGYASSAELQLIDVNSEPLDVDVVDTSWMDSNAVGPRHGYFHVNRWLIDDLAEIVETRRRATDRPHRLIRIDNIEDREDAVVRSGGQGNVFAFLAAPSWMGS